MDCVFTNVSVQGIAAVVPPRVIDIDSELEYFDNNPKKLERAKKIIGYGIRHVVDKGVTSVDLCEAAARKLLAEMRVEKNSIDALILVNQSPDHFLPSGSCILHGRLGFPKQCATLDVALGCSGYVHGLWLAHSLIQSGAAKQVLLLVGDTPSLHSDVSSRLTNPLFGDAGTATLLSHSDEPCPAYFNMGSEGTGWKHIVIPAGGFRIPASPEVEGKTYTDGQCREWLLNESFIDGVEVFNFTLHEIPPSIESVLRNAGKTPADIDFFAIHQANKQIVQEIGKSLVLPEDKVYWQPFSKYGNQSTASVAVTLCDGLAGRTEGQELTVALSGFGVGLSWGSAVLSLRDIYNGGVGILDNDSYTKLAADWLQ